MIILVYGNIGSGKTVSIVREIVESKDTIVFTNIDIFKCDHVIPLKIDMIIKREQVGTKRNGQPIYNFTFNEEYWKDIIHKYMNSGKQINVVIDEAHSFFNPRRSMSKINEIMTQFLALLRRIIGGVSNEHGNLILITQLSRRIDIIAKEMATQVRHCLFHYKKTCNKCNFTFNENNEVTQPIVVCPRCGYKKTLVKHSYVCEVFLFKSQELYDAALNYGGKTYYRHYIIKNIDKYFKYYNTIQWDNLFESLYK